MRKAIFYIGFLLIFWNTEAQIPFIYLEDLESNERLISDIQGESLTILDFWATWCKPCLIAIPELVKIQEDFRDSGINVIGINIDSPRNKSKIKPFSHSRGVNYPVLLDMDQELMSEMNVVFVPTMIILDRNGKQLFVHEGFNLGDEVLIREKILELLK